MNGYCPHCGQACTVVLVNGRGYCRDHGYVWVDWNPQRKDTSHEHYRDKQDSGVGTVHVDDEQ